MLSLIVRRATRLFMRLLSLYHKRQGQRIVFTGRRILVPISNNSFLKLNSGREIGNRVLGKFGVRSILAQCNLRVHDVRKDTVHNCTCFHSSDILLLDHALMNLNLSIFFYWADYLLFSWNRLYL